MGSLLAVPAAGVLLAALGFPEGFVAAGIVLGVCVFLVLAKALGALRALLLAVATAAAAAVASGVLAFGVCVATGCVG